MLKKCVLLTVTLAVVFSLFTCKVTPTPTPTPEKLKWSFETGGPVSSSPAIASDGTVYFGSNDSKLYALNPDGSLKWSFETEDWVSSSPAIASDGTVYFGSCDHKLYAFKEDNGGLADSPWPMFRHDPQHTGRR